MKIYIPTYNRVGNVKTLQYIPSSWASRTYLVHGPGEVHNTICHTIETPKKVEGYLSRKRQWICDNADEKFIFQMDDDLKFFRRDSQLKLKPVTPQDMHQFFGLMEKWLEEGLAVVGCSNRFMNHALKPVYQNRLVQANYGLNLSLMRKHGIKYSDVGSIQDQHVPLSLIEEGYTTQFTSEWAVTPSKMSAPGGCSTYRTVDIIKQDTRLFASLHPKTVRIIEGEKVKSHCVNSGITVRIDWKEAARLGTTRRAARAGCSQTV